MGRRIYRLRTLAGVWVVIGVGLIAARPALGDGCFVPERAYKKPPAIPAQRALVIYKDQVEQLVVESALDSEGQQFGWIVPVPATPMEMEATSPGLLKTLSAVVQPEITHGRDDLRLWLSVTALTVGLWAALMISGAPAGRVKRVLCLGLLGVICWLAVPYLDPRMMMTAGARGGSSDVLVEQTQTIGSYEVTLLRADSGEALNRWLDENGFAPLPRAGLTAIDDYVRQGWHFVAAKLQREGSGLAMPHPLSIRFPARRPVYPMRLTALSGVPLNLELFVLADMQADVDGLTTEFCDRLVRSEVSRQWWLRQQLPAAVSSKYKVEIGHPGLLEAMWDGCWLTKLTGVVTPQDMDKDYWLSLKEPTPYHQRLYSERGARDTGLIWGLGLWTAAAPIVVVAVPGAIGGAGRRRMMLSGCGACLAMSALLGLGLYGLVPKTEVTVAGGKGARLPISASDVLRTLLGSHGLPSERSAASVRAALQREAAAAVSKRPWRVRNQITGSAIREEDSPGNYTLHEGSDGVTFRWYDHSGTPDDIPLGVRHSPGGKSHGDRTDPAEVAGVRVFGRADR